MKRTRIASLVAISALAVMSFATTATAWGGYSRPDCYGGNGYSGRSLAVVGLTPDQKLFCFSSRDPQDTRNIGRVSGLSGDTKLIGIDFRAANRKLYGVGEAGGLYTVNERNGQATKVDELDFIPSGTYFGVDINPAADAVRIVSDTGQNLRHAFASGTTFTDGILTYPATATAPAKTATGVAGAAYTNNDADPNTSTTLFDIDTDLDQVVIQSPANSGLLAATGKLGVDTNAKVGFDIYSRIKDGTTVSLRAFASLYVDGRARFYSIHLLTGDAKRIGSFRSDKQAIDIAVPLNQQ